MRIALGPIVIWLGCLAAASARSSEKVAVVEVSGRSTADAVLRTWSADRIAVAQSDSSVREVPLGELLAVTFGRKSAPLAAGDPLVIMANGDRLVVRPVGVFEDLLTATWHKIPSRAALKLPLETVAAIVFDLPAAADDRQRMYADLQTLPAGEDIVLLANGDRVQGEFERLDGAFLHLKTASGLLKLDRTRVHAIRMNPELTAAPRMEGSRLMLSLKDGSRLTAQKVQLVDNDMQCVTSSKQEFLIPITEFVSCKVFGPRAVALADREPIQVTFVPYLSNPWPLVKNANVLRGPLALRGIEYGTGLGVHSRSLVTYELQRSDREFRAVVGIDDCADGAGSVRFGIELDGRRVWDSPEITGRSQPVVVPTVKLSGARKLTLIVDFGANADIADYADWCDAVLVRD